MYHFAVVHWPITLHFNTILFLTLILCIMFSSLFHCHSTLNMIIKYSWQQQIEFRFSKKWMLSLIFYKIIFAHWLDKYSSEAGSMSHSSSSPKYLLAESLGHTNNRLRFNYSQGRELAQTWNLRTVVPGTELKNKSETGLTLFWVKDARTSLVTALAARESIDFFLVLHFSKNNTFS